MEGFPRASSMTPAQRWLASLWPFVRSELPAAPARVLEIGSGPFGGFVPGLLRGGYEAVGIDRNAPDAPTYRRTDFEQYEPPEAVDAIVASRSLHHVGDLEDVLRRAAEALRPGGVLIVVEWAWERFDADTAHWCFARLGSLGRTRMAAAAKGRMGVVGRGLGGILRGLGTAPRPASR